MIPKKINWAQRKPTQAELYPPTEASKKINWAQRKPTQADAWQSERKEDAQEIENPPPEIQRERAINLTLDRLYNDPSSSAAFAGLERLWQEAKKELGGKLRKRDVQNYLHGHRTYTLMRPRRVHFKRTKTRASGFMTDMQTDLCDMQSLVRSNRGYRYILLAIDVLSKRLFVVPVRRKNAKEMLEAIRALLEQLPMKPHRIFSDLGTEFKNKQLKKFFEDEDIQKLESTSKYVKAAVAERAIRNLRQRLYRFFSQKKTLNWVDNVQKIVDGINNSPSRVHGMRPIDVNFKNAQQVWERIYGERIFKKRASSRIKPRFKVGDFVRVSRGKGIFEKEIIPNWNDEIYEIAEVNDLVMPVRYKLKNERGMELKGWYYTEELAKVNKNAGTTYRIEKTFRKEKNPDGTYRVLVKYIGYPDRQWIHESELV